MAIGIAVSPPDKVGFGGRAAFSRSQKIPKPESRTSRQQCKPCQQRQTGKFHHPRARVLQCDCAHAEQDEERSNEDNHLSFLALAHRSRQPQLFPGPSRFKTQALHFLIEAIVGGEPQGTPELSLGADPANAAIVEHGLARSCIAELAQATALLGQMLADLVARVAGDRRASVQTRQGFFRFAAESGISKRGFGVLTVRGRMTAC
jgi:hypothetical protein